jgi:hypothetical protein
VSILRQKKAGIVRKPTEKNGWCGCFTPAEIIALIAAGARPVESNQSLLEQTKNKIKTGDCTPVWFYFYKSEPFPR